MTRAWRRAATSEAARLIQVVVLPTPPFWLATAMTLPMLVFSVYFVQHQQVSLSLAAWHKEFVTLTHCEAVNKLLQFVLRLHAFHGQPAGVTVTDMSGPGGKIRQ